MLKALINTLKKNKGSVTVEAAVIFPFFISIILALFNLLNIINEYEMINYCLYKTCGDLADYAYIYHEKAISKFLKEYVDDSIDNADEFIYIPLSRKLFMKHVSEYGEYDKGIFNFSKSRFFNGNDHINLVVSYKTNFIVPIIGVKDINITQSCLMNAWINGVWEQIVDNTENIWLLNNFERGRKIRKIFGSNLPDSFPVIARFEKGRVVMIKSLDFTTETYKKEGAIYKKIKGFVKKLYNFKGQEEPWGRDNIVIKNEDIKERVIILVIPGDDMEDFMNKELDLGIQYARSFGINLFVERYGLKNG